MTIQQAFITTRQTQNKFLDNFIEVEIDPNKFLIIKETLTRIGVCPRNKNVLYQSCHILYKENRYFITHFKELFLLDGKESTMDELDECRRNQIANLLSEWGLLKILHPERFPVEDHYMKMIKIVSAKDKNNWDFVQKYHLGQHSNRKNHNKTFQRTDR